MQRSEEILFYMPGITRLQHYMCLAAVIILISLDVVLGQFKYSVHIFLVALIWFYLFIRPKYPCISIREEGIRLKELLGIFCTRSHAWSEFAGDPKQLKAGLLLTLKYRRFGPSKIMIPLYLLGEDDRLRVIELVKEFLQAEETMDKKASLKCFRCGSRIEKDEETCTKCGWTWQ
jgi:hypothetical protein